MAEKHSVYGRTYRGERASSGRKRETGTDLDGVPLRYTARKGPEMPSAFWDDFRADPEAAIRKWATD